MLDLLISSALQAGKIQRKLFQTDSLDTTQKTSHQNLVTQADLQSEKVIQKTLTKGLKDKKINLDSVGFISEETLRTDGEHLFIIDPLDGTNNFASGFPFFCTLIAYYFRGLPHTGLMYFPMTDTLYTGTVGKGAYRTDSASSANPRRSRLSVLSKTLKNCLVSTSITSDESLKQAQLARLSRIHPHVRGLRNTGSAGYDYASLCNNGLDVVVMSHNYIWDIAAASIIIQEAGASVYDWNGKPLVLQHNKPDQTYKIIATHHKTIDPFIQYF